MDYYYKQKGWGGWHKYMLILWKINIQHKEQAHKDLTWPVGTVGVFIDFRRQTLNPPNTLE